MTKLSVNINKIATLRNARGGNNPDVIKTALDCERFGANGITVHPRPDGRHIRFDDVIELKKNITTELNIEGFPANDFMQLVLKVKPAQCTLVPDAPDVITSDNGWDTLKQKAFLIGVVGKLKSAGIRVSLFMNPVEELISAAKETGTDRIELYTGPYAQHFNNNKEEAITDYVKAAQLATDIGLGINAGHDLNLENLKYFKNNLIRLDEVSIGHALICDALYYGLENTIQLYLRELDTYY